MTYRSVRVIAMVAMSVGVSSAARSHASPDVHPRPSAPTLVVRVIEDANRQPLPNAEVIDLGNGARRFTNAAGEARLPWPDAGRVQLRVRQLGFQFVDRELARSAPDGTLLDSVTIPLTRVAYVLPHVTTQATSAVCCELELVAAS